jgi:hypothetical protein
LKYENVKYKKRTKFIIKIVYFYKWGNNMQLIFFLNVVAHNHIQPNNINPSCQRDSQVRVFTFKLVVKHPQFKFIPFANEYEIPPMNNKHIPISRREQGLIHVPLIMSNPSKSSKNGNQIAEMLTKPNGKIL